MLWCHSHIVIFVVLFCCVRIVFNLSKSSSVLSQVSWIYTLAYFWWFTFLILQLKFSFEKPRRDEIPIWESPWGNPRTSFGFLEPLWSPRPPVWNFPALRRKSSYLHLFLNISAWITRQWSPVEEGVVPVWFSRSSKTASVASLIFSAASSMLVSTPYWQRRILKLILSQQSCSAHPHYTCLKKSFSNWSFKELVTAIIIIIIMAQQQHHHYHYNVFHHQHRYHHNHQNADFNEKPSKKFSLHLCKWSSSSKSWS